MRTVFRGGALAVLRGACVGVLLGAAEAALVSLVDRDLFLSGTELGRFVRVALFSGLSATLISGLGLWVVLRALRGREPKLGDEPWARRVAVFIGVLAWPSLSVALHSLSAGRRVRNLPGRLLLVLLMAAALALALAWLARRFALVTVRGTPRQRWLWAAGMAAWTLCALVIDARWLRRLYPAMHISLAAAAWLGAAAASQLITLGPRRTQIIAWLALAALLLAASSPLQLGELATAPNARFAVELAAPLTGKLMRWLCISEEVAVAKHGSQPAAIAGSQGSRSGLDLRAQDILLITIDALRADRLRAYGGHGLTPELDALAAQSVVFAQAYTPTPHTSYAVGSLLTGKYLRPVLSLPNAPVDHATLPRLLRRYGYRTAGFYPPAIFFVDEERFKALHVDHFGIEYVKEMFAPADQRVEQLTRYLDKVAPGHPLFVWVHLFEPHEPYEPPPAFRKGETPVALYDGEVAAADAAVGKLVQTFRAHRPGGTVIVTADHGEEFGEHGGYHHGTTLYEEQVRIPLLWSSPGKAPAHVVTAPVELVDLAPTVLAAVGVPRDARMRGDDLGAILLGDPAPAQMRAFASIDELQMWTDGRNKAICEPTTGKCRLFDLQRDPGERSDASQAAPAVLERLRSELAEFVASLPQVEAVAMDGGGGWPKALARARLGDASVGPQLLPLLGAARTDVRAEAVRAVARLRLHEARQVLATLRAGDPEAVVRDEAALAALTLGDADASAQAKDVLVRALSAGPSALDLARRAALLLASATEGASISVLIALARDQSAEEGLRRAAIDKLAQSHASAGVAGLVPVLADVRLRPRVVQALATIGGRAAGDAIARAFAEERYPESRTAEARALCQLRDPRAKTLTLHFLGTETSVPDGLLPLLDFMGSLSDTSGFALDLRDAPAQPPSAAPAGNAPPSAAELRLLREVLVGQWTCQQGRGCQPGADATLVLRAGRAPSAEARITVELLDPQPGAFVEIGGEHQLVAPGTSWVSSELPAARGARLVPIRASAAAVVRAIAIVPRTADIPPPAPKAFDAGVETDP